MRYFGWLLLVLLPGFLHAQPDTGRPVTLDPVTITPDRYDIRWVGSELRPRSKSHLGPRWKWAWRLEALGPSTAIRAIRIYRVVGGFMEAPLQVSLYAAQPNDSIPGRLIWQSDTLWPGLQPGWFEVAVPLAHWDVSRDGVWVGYQQMGTERRWEYTFRTQDSLRQPMTSLSQGSVIGIARADVPRPQALWTAHRWVPAVRQQWRNTHMLQVETIRPRRAATRRP